MSNSGIVNIRGKEYQTVAKRIADLRESCPSYTIETEIVTNGDLVCIKASISDDGKLLATGFAEEVRDSSNINKTSALENCETSAVGRALAFLGYGGSEIASANEVNDAIVAGAKKEVADYFIHYNAITRMYRPFINAVFEAHEVGDYEALMEQWGNIPDDDARTIFGLAPTKGGILTTELRAALKMSEDEYKTKHGAF